MNKLFSFEQFSSQKAEQAAAAVQEEQESKRSTSANKFKALLAEYGVSEVKELTEDQKRLKIREDVTNHNKKLFETAKNSGVKNFANFNDAGYLGLYGMRNKEIAKKKGLGKDSLLDRAGATELAANLFRITQTDEKLNNENINSQIQSEKVHNMVGGKIRQTIKDIGGTLPENLKHQKHIKEIKKENKKLTSQAKPEKLK
jgi:DNA-damage-inducible protein D